MNHLDHHERAGDEDLDEGSMGEILTMVGGVGA